MEPAEIAQCVLFRAEIKQNRMNLWVVARSELLCHKKLLNVARWPCVICIFVYRNQMEMADVVRVCVYCKMHWSVGTACQVWYPKRSTAMASRPVETGVHLAKPVLPGQEPGSKVPWIKMAHKRFQQSRCIHHVFDTRSRQARTAQMVRVNSYAEWMKRYAVNKEITVTVKDAGVTRRGSWGFLWGTKPS